jgi:ribulose-phosphate 3-epimerase
VGRPEALSGGIRLAPSILSADYAALADEVARVRPEADLLHVDVMDAHFVPNLTIGPPVVKALRRHTDLYLDCHLMMDNPGDFLEAFARAGADLCSVHVEAGDTAALITEMRRLDLDVAIAVSPDTPFAAAEPYLDELDLLLVMTVHPGFGGQSLIESVLPKIVEARTAIERRGLDLPIEVDGGVNEHTAAAVAEAGATVLVAGSAVYETDDAPAAARRIRDAATAGARS